MNDNEIDWLVKFSEISNDEVGDVISELLDIYFMYKPYVSIELYKSIEEELKANYKHFSGLYDIVLSTVTPSPYKVEVLVEKALD